jgi:hypothetical protein
MNCCICLEEINIKDEYGLIRNELTFKCNTCQEGLICYGCYRTINEQYLKTEYLDHYLYEKFCKSTKSMFLDCVDMRIDNINNTVKCPCCRNNNFKHLFKNVIEEINNIGEGDLFDDENFNQMFKISYYKKKPIFKKMYKLEKKLDKMYEKLYAEARKNEKYGTVSLQRNGLFDVTLTIIEN